MACSLELGSKWIEEKGGVEFSIYSENAEFVDLILFNDNSIEKEKIRLNKIQDVWKTFVSGIKPGQLYGYRIKGPYKPELGLRFNYNKLLIDPYSKAIFGEFKWEKSVFGYKYDTKDDTSFDEEDDSKFVPKCVVIDERFDWEDQNFSRIPWKDTIIYELHVKGFTKLREDLPNNIRGTYSGLSSPVMLNYLKDLGITTVELMPVQEFIDEQFLVEKGLRNYWGYNPINFFSPTSRYSSMNGKWDQVIEFKKMINELHCEGIEVIIDIVLNHTCEGNHLGPTLSFKGIENRVYYFLDENPRFYIDCTGTGNTINANHPIVSKMIIDCLRYWILEMHVDGFRIDLASFLARNNKVIDMRSPVLEKIISDPILSKAKFIVEPWDLCINGYQLGNFPSLFKEWNDKFRDTFRRFWRGEALPFNELADSIQGSRSIFLNKEDSSINYITCHDGFTLEDLVSYNRKHNEANCLDNKDGAEENYSWNCGFEGETDDPEVLNLREKQKRNFVITLFVSKGIPMVLGGDELSRTQKGNNNAFCQDNEISWFDWNMDKRKKNFFEFFKKAISIRKSIPYNSQILFLNQHGEEIHENPKFTNFLSFLIINNEKIFLVILNSSNCRIKFKFPLLNVKWSLKLGSANLKQIIEGKEEIEIDGKSSLIYEKIL